MIIEEHFYYCPYTGKPCRNGWDCAHCEVEEEEIKYLEQTESEDFDETKGN